MSEAGQIGLHLPQHIDTDALPVVKLGLNEPRLSPFASGRDGYYVDTSVGGVRIRTGLTFSTEPRGFNLTARAAAEEAGSIGRQLQR